MARSITEIQNDIIAKVQADPVLSTQLTSTSLVAVWRLWTYVVAVSIWTIENLFDLFKQEVDETISAMKPHSLRWYAEKAKAFQYGDNLVADADYYDNSNQTDDAVAAKKIVAYAAVVEQERGLRIKVAKDGGVDLTALSTDELNAFIEYMKKVKDAGVKLLITSGVADALKLDMDIYYNPLVINASGGRLDGFTSTPVQDAIKAYLKNLPFNGVFLIQNLVDQLQLVDGVDVINIKSAQAQYGALPFQSFAVQYIPDAGYLRIANDADLTINFIPYSE